MSVSWASHSCPGPEAGSLKRAHTEIHEESVRTGEAAERAKEGLYEGKERAKYTSEEAAQRAAEMVRHLPEASFTATVYQSALTVLGSVPLCPAMQVCLRCA